MLRSILASVLLSVSVLALAQPGNPPPQSGSVRDDTTKHKHSAKSEPVVVEARVTTSKSQVDVNRDAEQERDKAVREWASINIAGIAALVAILALAIAFVQLLMFRRQLGIMEGTVVDTSRAATSAERMAIATKAMADQAADRAKRELRPYISIKDKGIRLLTPQGIFQAFVIFTNGGRTPAKDVRVFLDHDLQDSGYQGPFAEQQRPAGTGFPLGPDREHSVRAVMPEVAREDPNRIARDREIFVWGRIDYTDIYGDSHWATFRFHTREAIHEVSYRHEVAQVIERRITGWALQPTPDGNDES